MDYARFAGERRATCDRFERDLNRARLAGRELSYEQLEQLGVDYRQLMHEQALASARFPGTAITNRLTQLALAGTHWLQRDLGHRRTRLATVLTRTVPDAFRTLLPLIGVAGALLVVATLFGLSLTVATPALGAAFLPQEALDGLRQGELWTESIFRVTPGAVASTKIATNNLSVAIVAWAGGAALGVGALWVLLLNGVMLGSVVATTWHYGMGDALWGFIATHGPLELSLIVVSAAAGLDIGRALVWSQDVSRAEALIVVGRRALVVLLACLPWFLVLGFVEGFVSPLQSMATSAKAGLGAMIWVLFVLFAFQPWSWRHGRVDPAESES